MSMDKATLALIISSISAVIAGLSLGWNIYRDIVLKPRLKVGFGVRQLFTPGTRHCSKFISLSATNFGTRSGRIEKIRIRKGTELLVLTIREFELPKKFESGERVEFELPYERHIGGLLFGDCSRVGLEDSFGRIHWAKRRDFKKARKTWRRDLGRGEIEDSGRTVRRVGS